MNSELINKISFGMGLKEFWLTHPYGTKEWSLFNRTVNNEDLQAEILMIISEYQPEEIS